MTSIGVTINLDKSIWSSGIDQNAIYLCETLKHGGYNVTLLYLGNDSVVSDIGYIRQFNPTNIKNILNVKLDLIIELGVMISKFTLNSLRLKNPNIKSVSYKCGNEFFLDSENILFNAHSHRNMFYKLGNMVPDQIWCIPQMEETNLFYYKYIMNQDRATVVPFIWSPTVLENECVKNGYLEYSNKDIESLAVVEPNISVFKNLLFPIVAMDSIYEKLRSKIKHIYLGNTLRLKENLVLKHVSSKSKMFVDRKMSLNDRISTPFLLSKLVDLVFSWQMYNHLNYLYFDVAWMGYPVVHNADMCKNIGYYYKGFNLEEASLKLQDAIENHKNDLDYKSRNRRIISKYLSTDQDIIKQYVSLVEDVLNDRFNKRFYDIETNNALPL